MNGFMLLPLTVMFTVLPSFMRVRISSIMMALFMVIVFVLSLIVRIWVFCCQSSFGWIFFAKVRIFFAIFERLWKILTNI